MLYTTALQNAKLHADVNDFLDQKVEYLSFLWSTVVLTWCPCSWCRVYPAVALPTVSGDAVPLPEDDSDSPPGWHHGAAENTAGKIL